MIELLFPLLADGAPWRETLLCALGCFAAASLALALRLLEQRLDYVVLPPRAERPENSTVIRFESSEQTF